MDKLIYERGSKNSREFIKTELSIPDDLNIYEFKIICIRLANLLGYSNEDIENVFKSDNIGD